MDGSHRFWQPRRNSNAGKRGVYSKMFELFIKKSPSTYKPDRLQKMALQVTERQGFSQPIVHITAILTGIRQRLGRDINLPESRVVFTIAATFLNRHIDDDVLIKT